MLTPQFTPVADSALLVTFADDISEQTHDIIVAFDKAIERAIETSALLGVKEVVPALVNVLLTFDPMLTDHATLEIALQRIAQGAEKVNRQICQRTVAVCYEETFASDLTKVAQACRLTADAVINAHLTGDYKVLMYGFAPGYAYMGGVDTSIQVPRKTAAVRDIASGSVLIAGQQCLVTTLRMPTGWSIIGRSPTQILLEDRDQPFLFDVGDTVTFQRIDKKAFELLNVEYD